jgi:hypothetical protein
MVAIRSRCRNGLGLLASVGVPGGAGLSVLAATEPDTKRLIAGALGLGLPDVNDLAWR